MVKEAFLLVVQAMQAAGTSSALTSSEPGFMRSGELPLGLVRLPPSPLSLHLSSLHLSSLHLSSLLLSSLHLSSL